MEFQQFIPGTVAGWAALLLSAFIVPALANLFYDYAMRPFIVRLGKAGIRIFTLGLKRSQDRLFKDVASRNLPHAGALAHMILAFVFVGLAGACIGLYLRDAKSQDAATPIVAADNFSKGTILRTASDAPPVTSNLRGWFDKYKYRAALCLAALSLFVAAGFFYHASRALFIYSIIRRFDHWLTILLPALSEDQERILKSRFAMVHDDASLQRLFDDLHSRLKEFALREASRNAESENLENAGSNAAKHEA